MKKTRILVLVIIVFILSMSAFIVVNAISPAKQLGINSTSTGNLTKELAVVGNYVITAQDVVNYKNTLQLQNIYIEMVGTKVAPAALDEAGILNHLIENDILYLEAEKQGLIVTDTKVDEYLTSMKEYYAKSKDTPEIALIRDFASGKGMSLNDYLYANKSVYKMLLSIGQLRSKYLVGITAYQQQIEKWDQVKADLFQLYASDIRMK